MGYSGVTTENTQIAKICLNFNFRGGGVTLEVKTRSAKICLNFNFFGGGVVKTQSAKIWLNFSFQGGSLIWNSREGLSGEFGHKFTVHTETCLCITDSLSHTTYVETNKNGSSHVAKTRLNFERGNP